MGFLEELKLLLGGREARDAAERRKLARVWGLEEADLDGSTEAEPGAEPVFDEPARGEASGYDRRMWIKKLRHLLTEKVPIPQQEWLDFRADAVAFGFDATWIDQQEREAFEFLLRRVVSDGVVTGQEHRQVELARRQIGLTESEATAMLDHVAKEAAELFGREIDRR